MLYLFPNSPKIIKAKRAFHEGMIDFVLDRIDKISTINTLQNYSTIKIPIIKTMFENLIYEYIDDILIGEPYKLVAINNQINPFIKFSSDFKKIVQYVFNYKLFTDKTVNRYDAYKLAESLDINTCPYCNRNYTNTVIRNNGEKLTRPQFDHYFDKADNPLLAVSFYNLIPSCSICNSGLKGEEKFNLNDYLHPYIDNNIDDIQFTYRYSSQTRSGLKIEVVTPNPSKAKKTIEVFAIEQVYNAHIGELLDLIKTKQYFSDRYLSILSSNLLRDVIVSREDLYRIVFGAEYDTIKFINRPFSKFKNDILKELGII